jgi:hypothetical protein
MKYLLVLAAMWLTCHPVFSQEVCVDASSDRTVEQFVEAQKSESENVLVAPSSDGFGCSRQGKVVTMIGRPICHLNFLENLTPVNVIFSGSVAANGSVAVVGYLMRGTKPDIDSAIAYFDKKYVNVTSEELQTKKWEHYYGFSRAWRNGDQYIVLGQHEPGYDPLEISLHLSIGSEAGLEVSGADLNSCK